MGTKTLYVAEEDEKVWQELRSRAGDTDASVSRTVAEALRSYLDAAQAVDDEESDVTVSISKADHTTLITRFRQLLRRYGRDRVSVAYARACYWEGASRSRAKTRADVTMGAAGRIGAARKAVATKGDAGLRRTARKAQTTRKAPRA
jgi:hypothetical protein